MEKVSSDVYAIDPFAFGIKGYLSVYLIALDSPILFDVGPSSSADSLISAVESLGYNGNSIRYIVVSHGHVDHAGGLSRLLDWAKDAKVVAGQSGVRHLTEPAKTVQAYSAGFPRLSALAGSFEPIPSSKIAAEYITLEAGGKHAKVINLPGHTHSQIGLQYGKVLMAGDSLSTNITLGQYYLPPSYPPNFDFSRYMENLDLVLSIDADTLCVSHFGAHTDVTTVVTKSIESVKWFRSQIDTLVKEGSSVYEAADIILARYGKDNQVLPREAVSEVCRAAALGLLNSVQKLQPHR